MDDEEIQPEKREALELHLVLRIMNTLGYVGDSEVLNDYLELPFNQVKIEDLLKERKSIIAHINKAMNESGL
jgi:hypothetical protein